MLHIQHTVGLGNFAFTQKHVDPFTAGAIISGGASILGGLLGFGGSKHAADKSLQATRETNKANAELAKYQNEWNLAQWNRQNAYNTPAAQRQRYEDAGINPYFALGNIQAGQAESLNSAEMANQQSGAEAFNHLAQGYQTLGASIAQAPSQFINAQYQQEQVKAMQLKNTEDSLSMMFRVNNLKYDNVAKEMSNQLFNANMNSLINITKNQERESYSRVAIASLQQVGTAYDVAQKKFTNDFILPAQRDLAQMSIQQMIAQVAYTKAQQKWTEKQTSLAAEYCAQGWLNAHANMLSSKSAWKNAGTQQYDVENQVWNRNQSTYRENYKFGVEKKYLNQQIKLGVDMLSNQKTLSDYETKYKSSRAYRGLNAFSDFGRKTIGSWSPIVFGR